MGVSRICHATLITFLIVHVGATCDKEDYPKCPLKDEYFHCQEDINNEYPRIEFCAERVPCGAGSHAVLDNATKTVTCEECDGDMYQPEEKWSNTFTQPYCDHIVSRCNEKQVVCENATSIQDKKCACNHTAGYKPDDTTACIKCFSPASKVCECVNAGCREEEILTEDFICTSSSSSSGTTTPISTSAPPNNTGYVLEIALPLVLISALCLVAIVVCCCYKRIKRKRPKRETLGDEDAPLKDTRPTTDNETSEVDGHEGNNHKERSKGEQRTVVPGVKADGEVHVGTANAAGSVRGGMGHNIRNSGWGLTIFSCCNTSRSDATNGQPTKKGKEKDNTERLEQQEMNMNVTGMTGGSVGTANTAGVVEGGMGNTYNSGGNDLETDGCDDEPNNAWAPLATIEDL